MVFQARLLPLSLILSVVLFLGGCAMSPPVQEMSDARQAVKAAGELQLDSEGKRRLLDAERYLEEATARIEAGEYEAARQAAIAAKNEAAKLQDEQTDSTLP